MTAIKFVVILAVFVAAVAAGEPEQSAMSAVEADTANMAVAREPRGSRGRARGGRLAGGIVLHAPSARSGRGMRKQRGRIAGGTILRKTGRIAGGKGLTYKKTGRSAGGLGGGRKGRLALGVVVPKKTGRRLARG